MLWNKIKIDTGVVFTCGVHMKHSIGTSHWPISRFQSCYFDTFYVPNRIWQCIGRQHFYAFENFRSQLLVDTGEVSIFVVNFPNSLLIRWFHHQTCRLVFVWTCQTFGYVDALILKVSDKKYFHVTSTSFKTLWHFVGAFELMFWLWCWLEKPMDCQRTNNLCVVRGAEIKAQHFCLGST